MAAPHGTSPRDPCLVLRDYVGEFPKLVAQSAFEEMRDDPTWGAEDRFPYGVISAMVLKRRVAPRGVVVFRGVLP